MSSAAGRTPAARRLPAHIRFRSGARVYLLARDLRPPAWARLVHADPRVARGVLERAARDEANFVRRLRSVFATDFGPAGQQASPGQILSHAALLTGRGRILLYDLGEAPQRPRPAADALRDAPAARAGGALADSAPAPAGLPARMLVVIEHMRHIPPEELGKEAAEFLALLATAGAVARLAMVIAGWAASHLVGAGWVIDAGLIGYGLFAIGVGIFQMLDTLLKVVRAVQGARTVGELKRQSRPLAKLLVEAGITVVVAFFLKGLNKRNIRAPKEAADPPAQRQGPARPASATGRPQPASSNPPTTGNGGPGTRPSWRTSELDVQNRLAGQGYRSQVSFKNGAEVPYGTKGSVRPEFYKPGSSIEVKNYNVQTASGRNSLIRNVSGQALQRGQQLPPGTVQRVVLDVRGQAVSRSTLNTVVNDIVGKSGGFLKPGNIDVMR